MPAGLVAGGGVVVDGAAAGRDVGLPPVDALQQPLSRRRGYRAPCQQVLGAEDLRASRRAPMSPPCATRRSEATPSAGFAVMPE